MSTSDPTPPTTAGQSSHGAQSSSSNQAPAPFASSSNDYNESIAIWQKFLSIGGQQATVEQAKQFQGLVVKAMCSQIQEESDRAIEAIRKMKEDNEESQS